jgi:Membrane protein involved in the export of O-antigen and teichoic acid
LNKKVESKKGKSQNFLHGALILTVGMAIVKVVGALFKVPLQEVIGNYGMGLFNVAYHFYGPIHSLSAAGLPIAVSRMVSECYAQERYLDIKNLKKTALPLFLVLGAGGTLFMFAFAPYYCTHIIKNAHALFPMIALAPAILFGCMGSIYRGFFEGMKNMYPTAVSEVIEAVTKLGIGIVFSYFVIYKLNAEYRAVGTILGVIVPSENEAMMLVISYASAAAIVGVTLGALFSSLYLIIRYKMQGNIVSSEQLRKSQPSISRRATVKILLKTAVPITIGALAVNIAGLIDMTFLQNRIAKLVEESPQSILIQYANKIPNVYIENIGTVPNFLFGCYSLALSIYMLVPTITHSLSISALPNITAIWAENNKVKLKQGIESVIRITVLLSLPAGIGITAIAPHIVSFLFSNEPASGIISDLLRGLGIAAIAAAVSAPVSSMLQAVGRADLPVKMLVMAMGIKVSFTFILCGISTINVYGAVIGTLGCYIFLAAAEIILLCRVTGIRPDIVSTFLKPFVAAVLCGLGAYASSKATALIVGGNNRIESLVIVAVSMCAGALIYIFSLGTMKAISENDILMLPSGEKIAKILEKHDWI